MKMSCTARGTIPAVLAFSVSPTSVWVLPEPVCMTHSTMVRKGNVSLLHPPVAGRVLIDKLHSAHNSPVHIVCMATIWSNHICRALGKMSQLPGVSGSFSNRLSARSNSTALMQNPCECQLRADKHITENLFLMAARVDVTWP